MSNLSQSSQRSKVKRKRRRRLMGSTSASDTQQSNSQLSTLAGDRSNNTSRVSMSREQSHDQAMQSPDRSQGQRSVSRDNSSPRMSRVTEERETQSSKPFLLLCGKKTIAVHLHDCVVPEQLSNSTFTFGSVNS